MSVITISTGNVEPYQGSGTPTTVRLYANQQFTTSDNIVIPKASKQNPTFYQEFTCSMTGDTIRIASGTVHSTTDSNQPRASYTVVVYDANGIELVTLYKDLRVPSTVTPTTWAALETYSRGYVRPYATDTLSSDEIMDLFNEYTDLATKASDVVYGATSLDTAPALAADPEAVGTNSNRIEKNLSSDYSNSFATAITSIGSSEVTLVVKNAVTVSSNTTLPDNIILDIKDGGLITVNASRTLTIGKMLDPGSRQVFVQADSSANIRFSQEAVPAINLAWIVGDDSVSTNGITQALASCSANGGGVVYIPQGLWYTAGNHAVPSNTIIKGDGKDTVLECNGNADGVFKIGLGVYDVSIRDLVIDGSGFDVACVLCSAANGEASAGHLELENVRLRDATYGLRIYDTLSTEWQMAAVSLDAACRITNCTYGMWCNTTNNVVYCEAFFEVSDDQWAVYLEHSGQWTFSGCEFAGSTSSAVNQVESQTIVAASGVTGAGTAQSVVTAAGMVGSPVTVDIPVDTTMTTATLVATAFRKYLGLNASVTSFFHIGGTGATVELIPLDPAANDGTMNFTINTGTATGISNSATSTNSVAGVADATRAKGVYIGGSHGTINFIGTVDEQFGQFLLNDSSDTNGVINFIGATIQSPIQLDGTCALTTIGCNMVDRIVRDSTSSSTQYKSIGDTVVSSTYLGGAFRTLSARTPHNFNGNTASSGSSVLGFGINSSDERVEATYPFRSFQNAPWSALSRTKARMELMSSVDPGGGADWPMLRIGRCTETGDPLYYFDAYRKYSNGRLQVVGNQTGTAGATGVDFNGDISGVNFRGAEVAPAQITSNQNNYTPATDAQFLLLTSDASRTITGLSSPYAQNGGEVRVIQNIGSFNIVLAHQSGSSTAGNRFISPTATDVTLAPNDIAYCVYDGTTRRWRILASNGTGSAIVGYSTGAGGTVTQITSKSTGVTLNKRCGQITMNNASLNDATNVSFTVTNSTVTATDTIVINHGSAGTAGAYSVQANNIGAGSFGVTVRNQSGGALGEAIVLNFAVVKGVSS